MCLYLYYLKGFNALYMLIFNLAVSEKQLNIKPLYNFVNHAFAENT
jgi:hypothetical protein